MSEYKYFTNEELKCKCGCEQQLMDHEFMVMMDNIRQDYRKPIIVSSAYRCPDHNEKVSTTGRNGPHTTGKAIDIAISGEDALSILFISLMFPIKGLGIKQKGSGRFIHIDTLTEEDGYPRPTIWSY